MFYQAISQNRTKTFFLMVAFFIVVAAIGWAAGQLTEFGDMIILPAILFALILTWSGYYYSDKLVIASVGAHPVDRYQEPYLVNVVEGLSIAAGIPVPACYIMESEALNAFATGRNPQNAAVCVTRGLLNKLNRQELEGVIAHEMSHIRNYDILIMTIAAVLVGGVAIMRDILFRMMWYGGGRRSRSSSRSSGNGQAILLIIALILLILSPILVNLMRLALSRNREYLADASAVQLTRNPDGLISALRSISTDSEKLEGASNATAHLFISNPLAKIDVENLFSTHPPITKRIQALEKM